MKKLFAIFLMFCLTIAAVSIPCAKAKAQTVLAQTDPSGATSTTNTNADTSYHTIDMAGSNNNFSILNFVMKGTKTSGTVAGAATLWASMDNSRWFALYGRTSASTTDTTTSQALTDGDTNFFWILADAGSATRWRYYRVRVITTGTQVSTYQVRLLGRKVAN